MSQLSSFAKRAILVCFVGLATLLSPSVASVSAEDRPNILWITSEDNGPQLGCYGDRYADTPNLDALAAKSLRYKTCWSNAPVCAPARTCLISGMYATALGGQHMRSGVSIPKGIQLYPQLFREAGYFTTNKSKTDYNFVKNVDAGWHENGRKAHWRNRPSKDTPFFSVFNSTISHESKIRVRPHTLVHDPAKAPVPSYHPDTPEVRHDWAQYYDKMTAMDKELGKVLDQLKKDGLEDSTIIFYYGDHGSGMPRSKRWPFNSGLHVPLIIHVPEKFKHLAPPGYDSGDETAALASFVDMAPTSLAMAGIEVPSNMQGIALNDAAQVKAREYVFGFRGRMDERIDMVRSCTDGRYVYLRHFYPDRPYLKYVAYMFQTPTTRIWKEMFDRGELNEIQAKVWEQKPVEELFDLQSDPDETKNLALNPDFAGKLKKMRTAVKDWMVDIGDLGVLAESKMHELAKGKSPRSVLDSIDHKRLVEVAFNTMSTTPEDADFRVDMESDLERYWAVRGITSKIRNGTMKFEAVSKTLLPLMKDDSPAVAIAAADAALRSGNTEDHESAKKILISLADVNQYGHFVAAEALNVLDMNADLSQADLDKIRKLPKQAAKPPVRAEKYVTNLLNHLVPESK